MLLLRQKRGLVLAVLAKASYPSQSILRCMTPGNCNWFLHTMLFYHTKYVIFKQEMKKLNRDEEENWGLDEEVQDDEDN